MSGTPTETTTTSTPAETASFSGFTPDVLFETTVSLALTGGETQDMMPVWNHFLNAEFFVAIIGKENGPINGAYDFSVFQTAQHNEPYILVSEYPEKLTQHAGQQAVRVRGGGLIHSLNPKHAIVVALSQNSFTLPTDLLNWLREHTKFVPTT